MRLEFVTQSSRNSGDFSANTERLVNLYPEPIPEGGAARFVLRSVLGYVPWANLTGVFTRALHVMQDRDTVTGAIKERLFATVGGKLWELLSSGAVIELVTISDCPETTLSSNNGLVTLVCDGRYFVWDGTALTEPTAGAFSDMGACEYLGGYTIITERNGRRFQWSALADAETLPGLNFASAEALDDPIVRPVAINGNLWIFKRRSTEIWGLTGQASENAFSRLGAGVIERGVLGHNLIAKAPNAGFFVGDDGIVYITNGADLQPISRTPVERAIREELPTHCAYYEDEGHKFCVVRFDKRPAWVCDLSTGLWHERASSGGAWTATHMERAFGSWRAGGIEGRIVTLARTNSDNGEPLVREATSRTLAAPGGRFVVDAVEFSGRVGRSDIGRESRLAVQFSRDGGNTWGTERLQSMGDLGEYDKRMVFRSVGQCRRMTARVRISDPADLQLWSAANLTVRA